MTCMPSCRFWVTGFIENEAFMRRPTPNDNGLFHEILCLYALPIEEGSEPIDGAPTQTPTRGQVPTHWKSTKKWALVDPLTGDAAPCRLRGAGARRPYAPACKGSAAEFVAPITMRHRLPFAHYAAPYAAVLACKSADGASGFARKRACVRRKETHS